MFFKGKKAVLATMHGKEQSITPILAPKTGLDIVVPDAFDTDKFGTFTRDIKRPGNQLAAARKKAFAAMELTGSNIGIASEGVFGSHPLIPLLPFNHELIVLIDKTNGLEIIGTHSSSQTNMAGAYVTSVQEAVELATQWGFPQDGVIVRKRKNGKKGIEKRITDEKSLREAVEKILSKPFTTKAYIETDMRAHKNSKRRVVIEQAAHDLAENILSLCPTCQMPGFSKQAVASYVLCGGCGRPSTTPATYVYRCNLCNTSEERSNLMAPTKADPVSCSFCNP